MKKLLRVTSNTRRQASRSRRRNSRTIVTRQNWRGPRSSLVIRRHFLRISASWTSARCRKLLRSLRSPWEWRACTRLLQQDEHFQFGSTDMQGVLLLACGWRDAQNWNRILQSWMLQELQPKTLAMQLNCQGIKHCTHLMLSWEIVSSLRSIQRGKCLPQSLKTCEQSWEIQNSQHTQSSWNIVLELNYHENAALVDAHAKKCKFSTKAESAHKETVAQRTSFAEMRRIPELEELMTCSCQSDTKFDQASLQVESETGRSVLEQGCVLLSRVPLPITSRKASKGMRDDQQSHYLSWRRRPRRMPNTRFGVTLNWHRTLVHNSRFRWWIWQWKWRNSRPGVPTSRGSIQSRPHLLWGNGDKRRGHQGCVGRSIEPDTGNSDSDGLLCEGWSGRLSYTTESAFRSLGHRRIYNRNQVGGTNIFGSLQVIQMVAPRDSRRKPQPTSPKRYALFDELTGRMVQSVWSVILDSDQRFCPTLVQAGRNVTLEDYENALHQVNGKA